MPQLKVAAILRQERNVSGPSTMGGYEYVTMRDRSYLVAKTQSGDIYCRDRDMGTPLEHAYQLGFVLNLRCCGFDSATIVSC